MPKETFNRIAEEKRERILKTAAGLFAHTGFYRTDMALIANRAGVAKGSLYNYFSDKEDLYRTVCRDGIERSRRAVYAGLRREWNLYRQIDHIFRRGMAFARNHPEYIRLYLNVSSAGMERFAEQLSLEVEKYTSDFLKAAIRGGIEKGEARDDVDVKMTAFLINSLYIMSLVSVISRHFRIRMTEYLEIEGDLTERDTERYLSQVIDLVKDMLKPAGS